jgi:hypothetical protein
VRPLALYVVAQEHGDGAGESGYRAVLRDRNFVWLLGLNVIFVAVGYEVFALLPPLAKNYAGVSERWVGTMFLANTILIVLIQLPVSKALGMAAESCDPGDRSCSLHCNVGAEGKLVGRREILGWTPVAACRSN